MSELYALDLDEELLSHLTSRESWLVINAEAVDPVLIEDEEIRAMFVWQRDHLRTHGVPATPAVLADEWDLAELNEPETQIGDLIDRIRERYARNQGREALREIVRIQKDEADGPMAIAQLLLKKGRELGALVNKRGGVFASHDLDRAHMRYHKKVLAGPGASVGFPELDTYFYGMRGVTIWIAPPKTMKSWIMCKGVLQNTLMGKYPWIYSLELPEEETDMRLRCLAADIPWWKYIYNQLTDDDWVMLNEANKVVHETSMYKVVKPPPGHRSIDEMVHVARDAGADVIFIDQLQYVENGSGRSIGSLNNTGDYWDVLNRSRDLSDDGPICFAHQFNRSAMFASEMPRVEQAKGSSSIEEVATLALGMWADRDMRRACEVEIGTLIARNHEYASWRMEFNLADGCAFEVIERCDTDDDNQD